MGLLHDLAGWCHWSGWKKHRKRHLRRSPQGQARSQDSLRHRFELDPVYRVFLCPISIVFEAQFQALLITITLRSQFYMWLHETSRSNRKQTWLLHTNQSKFWSTQHSPIHSSKNQFIGESSFSRLRCEKKSTLHVRFV